MSDQPLPSAPAPRDDAALPATPPVLDANGFDPTAYKWIPVARRERADGWTADKQRAFIEALADECSVTRAAAIVGMSSGGAYKLRRLPGGERFKAAWDAALREGAAKLADELTQRAIDGVEEPVFYKGERVGTRRRYNDRLGMFLLRAHMPEVYDADRRGAAPETPGSTPGPAPAAAVPTVAAALESLTPAMPDAPHLSLAPDELAEEVLLADTGDGALPVWHHHSFGSRTRVQKQRRDALRAAGHAVADDAPDPWDDDSPIVWPDTSCTLVGGANGKPPAEHAALPIASAVQDTACSASSTSSMRAGSPIASTCPPSGPALDAVSGSPFQSHRRPPAPSTTGASAAKSCSLRPLSQTRSICPDATSP
jgi:hypothetical protein